MFADKLWIKVLKPVWSFIVNAGYWTINVGDLKWALEEKKRLEKTITCMAAVEREIGKFDWTKDSLKDWTQWVITTLHRGRDGKEHGDCDDSAVLGKFCFACIGIKSDVLSLRGDKCGHAVCVDKKRSKMISNSRLKYLNAKIFPGGWEEAVLFECDSKYHTIL